MPRRSLARAFVILWWTTGILLFSWSARTAQDALQTGPRYDPHLAILGSVEAVFTIVFLIPRTMRFGAAGLLVVFAVAFLAHAAQREFQASLLLYAVVVAFVAVHGPVPMSWLRSHR